MSSQGPPSPLRKEACSLTAGNPAALGSRRMGGGGAPEKAAPSSFSLPIGQTHHPCRGKVLGFRPQLWAPGSPWRYGGCLAGEGLGSQLRGHPKTRALTTAPPGTVDGGWASRAGHPTSPQSAARKRQKGASEVVPVESPSGLPPLLRALSPRITCLRQALGSPRPGVGGGELQEVSAPASRPLPPGFRKVPRPH